MDPLSQLSLLATQLLKEEPPITVSSASHAPPQPHPPHIPPPPHQRHTTIRTIHNPCKDHLILVTCKSVCKGISFEHAQRPTFIGYLKTPLDAALLVEAVVSDTLPLVRITETTSHLLLQSGTICVMKKEHGDMMLNGCNKQGSRWSFGIEQGLFTIFREVEPMVKVQERCGIGNKEEEGKPRLVTDGLCKKSIPITGSDGIEYLVIGYYYAKHVVHFYTRPPFPVPGAPPPKAPLNSLIIPSETTQFNHLLPRIHPSLNPPRPNGIPLFQAYCPIFRGIENAECTCPPSLKPLRFRHQQTEDAFVKKLIGNTPDSSPERKRRGSFKLCWGEEGGDEDDEDLDNKESVMG